MGHRYPRDWKQVKLTDISELITKGTTPTTYGYAYTSEGVRFLKVENVLNDGSFDNSKLQYISDETQQRLRRSILKEGDILFSIAGALGRCATVTKCLLPANINQALAMIRIKSPDVHIEYLCYFLRTLAGAGKLAKLKAGVAQQNLSLSQLKDLTIVLPPLATQIKIVTILDEANSLRMLRKQADDKMKGLIPALFDEMFGDPLGNERGWPVKCLGDIALDVQYGTSAKANESGDGIPVLRMNNINYDGSLDLSNLKHTELADEEYDKYTVHYGDILINRTNSRELVGKTAVWDKDYSYAFAGYLVRFRLNPNIANPFYVSSALNLPSGKSMLFSMAKPAVNMSNISASDMKRIRLAMPPVELQNKFSGKAKEVVSNLEVFCEARHKLDELFNSLMDRCMNGKVL